MIKIRELWSEHNNGGLRNMRLILSILCVWSTDGSVMLDAVMKLFATKRAYILLRSAKRMIFQLVLILEQLPTLLATQRWRIVGVPIELVYFAQMHKEQMLRITHFLTLRTLEFGLFVAREKVHAKTQISVTIGVKFLLSQFHHV